MLATGPLLTTIDRPVLAKVDLLQDETQRLVVPRLSIVAINRESPSRYNNSNDGSVTLGYTVQNGPPDQGVTMSLDYSSSDFSYTGSGGFLGAGFFSRLLKAILGTITGASQTSLVAKTSSRGANTTFTGMDEQGGIRNLIIYDASLESRWCMKLDVVNRAIIYNGKYYYVGQNIDLPIPFFVAPRLLVNNITRETPNQYSNANNATASFTYYLSEGPADAGIQMDLASQTKTVARGATAAFGGLDEHTGNTLSVVDLATGGTWTITLDIVNTSVIYANRRYRPGEYIYFNSFPSSSNNGAIQLTISNVRSGIASVVCNGVTYTPVNKPPLATKLAQQTFSITNLDGNGSTPYAISIYNPYVNKTYSLSATIGFKRLSEPSNTNKSYITHKKVNYKQGTLIRLIPN
jgi:hypothetical protein